jgi:hypothetical protein
MPVSGGGGRSQRGTQSDRGDCSERKFPQHGDLLKTAGAGCRVDEKASETVSLGEEALVSMDRTLRPRD